MSVKKITKILIANRGEIAVRIMRACSDMGITSVAVFSEADRTAYHVRMADEAYCIGPAPSSESYLVQDSIIEAVRKSAAEAVHPGYGFLAENAEFAQRCGDEGIVFIGPEPETIRMLGDKIEARAAAVEAGLPVIAAADIDPADMESALKAAGKIGYPVLVKAAAGGGGKGMRVVEKADQLAEAVKRAGSEALSAFGDGRVFIERFLRSPRHIEIQILCDQHGNCIHLGERECSIQRRHQKLIEESPSPVVTPALRQKMGAAALSIARRTGYVGAGTVEFMLGDDGSFYFLEVNTRLQVEHPVTELVTGIDLVREQIRIAEGYELPCDQESVRFNGHAIECRICAEDPERGFMPSTGQLKNYRLPAGPGVRVDSGVVIFSEVPVYYDPLIAKLIVWGKDRSEAIARMKRAIEEYRLSGVHTTLGFHRAVMENERFISGDISTEFITKEYPDGSFQCYSEEVCEGAAIAVALDQFLKEGKLALSPSATGRADSWSSFHRRANLRRFGGSR